MKLNIKLVFIACLLAIPLLFLRCTESIEVETSVSKNAVLINKLSKDENLREYVIKVFEVQRQINAHSEVNSQQESLKFINEILEKSKNINNESDLEELSKLIGYSNVELLKKDISLIQKLSGKIEVDYPELKSGYGNQMNPQIIGDAVQKMVIDNKSNSSSRTTNYELIPPVPDEEYNGHCADREAYVNCIWISMGEGTVGGLSCAGLIEIGPWAAIACGSANFISTIGKYRMCYANNCPKKEPKRVEPIDPPTPRTDER